MCKEHYYIKPKKCFMLPVFYNQEFTGSKNGNEIFKAVLKKLSSQYQQQQYKYYYYGR
jgi:hypothetical protein